MTTLLPIVHVFPVPSASEVNFLSDKLAEAQGTKTLPAAANKPFRSSSLLLANLLMAPSTATPKSPLDLLNPISIWIFFLVQNLTANSQKAWYRKWHSGAFPRERNWGINTVEISR
jgi:hypothetical protein